MQPLYEYELKLIMHKKIKIKKILIFLIPILILVFVYLSIKKHPQEETQQTAPFPELSLPSYIKGTYDISFDVKQNELNLPTKLSYLEKEDLKPLTKEESYLIAKNLGFETDPLDITDVKNGEILIWNNETNFLTVTLAERKIKYGPNYNPSEKESTFNGNQFSENEMSEYAENFLIDKFGFLLPNITISSYKYLKIEEGLELFQETAKENAQILQLNFNQGTFNYPLITLNPQQTDLYIQLLKDETILNMEIFFVGNITKSQEEFSCKNFDEIVSSANKAEIVSINNGNVNLSDIDNSQIEKMLINKIAVAYYLENPNDEYFQPVYLLEGSVKIKGFSEEMPVSLYLAAFR